VGLFHFFVIVGEDAIRGSILLLFILGEDTRTGGYGIELGDPRILSSLFGSFWWGVRNLTFSIAKMRGIPILEIRALRGDNEEEELVKLTVIYALAVTSQGSCFGTVPVRTAHPYTLPLSERSPGTERWVLALG
jgi:hypothetical protein